MAIWRVQVLLAVLLALLTSYTVAWVANARSRPALWRNRGPTLAHWLLGPKPLASAADEYWIAGIEYLRVLNSSFRPRDQSHPWLAEWLQDANATGAIVRSAGWPCRSVVSGRTFYQDDLFRDWGMVHFGGPETVAFPFESSVAWRPIWLGLVANTAVYGLAWWIVLGGPITATLKIRASRRRGTGQCPACGYDLSGQREPGCPECGGGRQQSAPDTGAA